MVYFRIFEDILIVIYKKSVLTNSLRAIVSILFIGSLYGCCACYHAEAVSSRYILNNTNKVLFFILYENGDTIKIAPNSAELIFQSSTRGGISDSHAHKLHVSYDESKILNEDKFPVSLSKDFSYENWEKKEIGAVEGCNCYPNWECTFVINEEDLP